MMYSALLANELYNAFFIASIVFMIVLFVAALVAIVIVLFQQSNSDGIQGITGSSETFFGKNKGQSIESKLKKWTWICLTVLAVLSIAAYIIAQLAIRFLGN
jgi:preprotein translocase subunit SecG